MSLTATRSSPSASSRIFSAARPILPRPLIATVAMSLRVSSTIADQLRENDSVVVLGVAGGVDDRERATPRAAAQLLDLFAVRRELVAVARAELREPLGHVVEPLAQLVAGRQLARPRVQAGTRLRESARPDMVDQHAVPVTGVGLVIDALCANVDRHRYSPGTWSKLTPDTTPPSASTWVGRIRARRKTRALRAIHRVRPQRPRADSAG